MTGGGIEYLLRSGHKGAETKREMRRVCADSAENAQNVSEKSGGIIRLAWEMRPVVGAPLTWRATGKGRKARYSMSVLDAFSLNGAVALVTARPVVWGERTPPGWPRRARA